MMLTNIKLGDYIKKSTKNNNKLLYGEELIEGVSNQGIFTHPKGSTRGVNLKPYKIIENGAFVYNPTRLNIGSIAYRTDGLCIVSHLYIVFYLTEEGKKIIHPDYLFMYFRRKEFLREVEFRNFGSQRPEFSFKDMSEITIPLPPLYIQEKYVAVYKSMLANQKAYETGLEDLKLVCDAELDVFKINCSFVPAKNLFNEIDKRNSDNKLSEVLGININKEFMPSKAASEKLDRYKIIEKNQFAYSSMQTGRDEAIRIALYSQDTPSLVSPAYSVLETNSLVLPEYIMMWFSRTEMDRYGWFLSDSSIRANLDLKRFYEIEIPIPPLQSQQCIVDIYNAYITRKEINEKLKQQIKDICPILIAGAIKEAKANG